MAAFAMDGKTLTAAPDVAWRDVAGEIVAVNVRSGDYFTFNEVGRLVWLDLTGGGSLEATAARIAEEYDVARPQATADTRRFVEMLCEKRLVSAN
jgi:hypothetical protein